MSATHLRRLAFFGFWIILLWFVFAVGIDGADADALWYDEIRSVAVVGGAHFGPYNPVDIIDKGIINGSLTQLPAYYFTLWVWGFLVGWSELAMRSLTLFFSLLALAWTYRLGRDLYSERAGLMAAVILGISSFFLYYTHELRTFTLVVLATSFTLWCYHQLMQRAKPSRWWQVGLFFGLFTLLHTHYFAMPVAGALGLYHVLFQRRHWWRPVVPTLVAGGIALLWLPIFFVGYNHIEGDVELHGRAIGFFESIAEVLHYFGNGLPLLLIALLAVVTVVGWRVKALRFMAWMAIVSMLLMAALNEVTHVLTTSRIRYLIGMWPLLAIWLAVGLAHLSTIQYGKRISSGLLAVWLVVAVYANLQPTFLSGLNPDPYPRWRTITNAIEDSTQPNDVFVFHAGALADEAWYPMDYATAGLGIPSFISLALYDDTSPENQAWAWEQVDTAQRIWYGVDTGVDAANWRNDFEAILNTDFVYCGLFAQDERLQLWLYARSAAHCPGGGAVATFGEGITLAGVDVAQTPQTLRVSLGFDVAQDVPLHTYSAAVQLIGADGQPAAQADAGLPPGHYATVTLNVPLDQVQAGDYDMVLIIYNWQTLERLGAAFIDEASSGDSLLLDTVTIASDGE